MYQVDGIWKGVKYTVGFNKGRVGQFYRKKYNRAILSK